MNIDLSLILRLEELARLDLSDKERERLKGDLDSILTMVEKLNDLDTEGVEPLVYLNDEIRKLRPDEVNNEVSTEAALKNAPDSEAPYFKVPKVIP